MEEIEKLGNEFFGEKCTATEGILWEEHTNKFVRSALEWWTGHLCDGPHEFADRQIKANEVAPIFQDYLLDRGIEVKVFASGAFVQVQLGNYAKRNHKEAG